MLVGVMLGFVTAGVLSDGAIGIMQNRIKSRARASRSVVGNGIGGI